MIRIILFFIFLSFFIGLGLWLSGQPGSFLLTWEDYELQGNLGIFFTFFTVLIILSANIWLFLRWIWSMPSSFRRSREIKNYKKSSKLLVQFFDTYISEDFSTSLKKAKALRKKMKSPSLSFWLESKVAAEKNDLDLSKKFAIQASKKKPANFLGYCQLATISFHQRQYSTAATFLEKALELQKQSAWAKKQLSKIYLKNSNWSAAKDLLCSLPDKTKSEKIEKNLFLSTAYYMQALDKETKDENKRVFLQQATKQTLRFIPSIEAYTALIKNEENSTCSKLLEKSWKIKPSLNIGNAYANMLPEEEKIERFKAAQYLLSLSPAAPESFFLIIQKAIDAQLWGEAKAYMEQAFAKKVFYQSSLSIKILKRYLENTPLQKNTTSSYFSDLPPVKSTWQCTHCDYFQEEWFSECPSCQSLLQYKLKNIF